MAAATASAPTRPAASTCRRLPNRRWRSGIAGAPVDGLSASTGDSSVSAVAPADSGASSSNSSSGTPSASASFLAFSGLMLG